MNVAGIYVPQCLLALVGRGQLLALPLVERVEGSLLMADVSGFTSLSERLAEAGAEGAEELTGIINRSFTRILAAATPYGGDILTFAGDAVLVLFQGENHALRATGAALGMLSATTKIPAVHVGGRRTKLGMSAGLSSGSFFIVAAVIRKKRLQLVVIGPETEVVATAEHHAREGQLVVSQASRRALANFAVEPVVDGFWLVPPRSCAGLGCLRLNRYRGQHV
jgi:class 3 adenylate cyclase